MHLGSAVSPTHDERRAVLPGDRLVAADVVMDRAFTLDATPTQVWPWLVQIGKDRAGWYFPRSVERFSPAGRRGARRIRSEYQDHEVGQVISDWGGRDATLTVAEIDPERALVYRSQRGRVSFSWALLVTPVGAHTRVHSWVRLGPVRREWLAEHGGGMFDLLTIWGLATGLQERLREQR